MSVRKILSNPAMQTPKAMELNEEWNNFVKKIGEVSGLVKDMASGDKKRADAAASLADQYLNGKVIFDEDVEMKVKSDRTVINAKAFRSMENDKVRPQIGCLFAIADHKTNKITVTSFTNRYQ